jgi:hypothetical protein
MTRRFRADKPRTIMSAHCSAVMSFDSCIGVSPSGVPSGPTERLWISVTTKSGATIVMSTPVPMSSMRSESKKPFTACLLAA